MPGVDVPHLPPGGRLSGGGQQVWRPITRNASPAEAGPGDMVRVSIDGHPLTATAALVWNGDLPRLLQQILFDTADGLTRQAPASLSRAG